MQSLLKKYVKFKESSITGMDGKFGTLNEDMLSQFTDCRIQGHVKEYNTSIRTLSATIDGVYILLQFTEEAKKKQKASQGKRERQLDANNIEMCQRYKDEKAMRGKSDEDRERECLKSQKAKVKEAKEISSIGLMILNFLLKGVSVRLSNVHLRVETDSGCYGVVLKSLDVTKNKSAPKSVDVLVCRLNGLRAYADPLSQQQPIPTEMNAFMATMQDLLESEAHEWIFSYSTGDNNNISLEIPKKVRPGEPIYKLSGFFPQFSVNLTKPQYVRILSSLSGNSAGTDANSSTGGKNALNSEDFAVLCKVVSVLKRRRLIRILERRRRYIDLYRAFLMSGGKRGVRELKTYENHETVETLIMYRYVALAETTSTFQSKLKASGIDRTKMVFDPTVMSATAAAPQQPDDLPEKRFNLVKSLKSDLKKLFFDMKEEVAKEQQRKLQQGEDEEKGDNATDMLAKTETEAATEAAAAAAMRNTSILLQTVLTMNKFEIVLKNDAADKEPVLRAMLDVLSAEVKYGTKADLSVSLTMNDAEVAVSTSDTTANGAGKAKILERKDTTKPLLGFTIRDKKMLVEMRPFFLTFEDKAIGTIAEFFVPPCGMDVSAIKAHLKECFGMYSLLARDELIERALVPGPGEGLIGIDLTVILAQPTIRMFGDNDREADISVGCVKMVSTSTPSKSNPKLIIQTGFTIDVSGTSFSLRKRKKMLSSGSEDENEEGSKEALNVVAPFNTKINLGLPVYSVKSGDGIPIAIISNVDHVCVSLNESVLLSSLELVRPFLHRLFPIVNNYILSLASNKEHSERKSCTFEIEDPVLPIMSSTFFQGLTFRWSDAKSGALLLESALSESNLSCNYAQFLLNGEAEIKKFSVREHFTGSPCELLSVTGVAATFKDTNMSHANVSCSVKEVVSALNMCSVAQSIDVTTKLAKAFIPDVIEIVSSVGGGGAGNHKESSVIVAEKSSQSHGFTLENIHIPIRLSMTVKLDTVSMRVFDPETSIALSVSGISSSFSMDDAFTATMELESLGVGVIPQQQKAHNRKMVTLGLRPDSKDKARRKGLTFSAKFVPRRICLSMKTKVSHVRADTSDLRDIIGFAGRMAALFVERKTMIVELQKEIGEKRKGGEEGDKKRCTKEDVLFGKLKEFLFLTPPEKLPTVLLETVVEDVLLDFVPPFAPNTSIRITVDGVSYKNTKENPCGVFTVTDVRMGSLGYYMLDAPLTIRIDPSITIDREAQELRVGVRGGMSDVFFVVVPEQIPELTYLAVGGIQSMFSSTNKDVPFPPFFKVNIEGVVVPRVLAQLRLTPNPNSAVMNVYIQRIEVKGAIVADKQEFTITGRRIFVDPVKEKSDACSRPSRWPKDTGDNTVVVQITRKVDTDAFRYKVAADVSELNIGDFSTKSIFRGFLPFATGINIDLAGNLVLPPCKKDRIPTLVDVGVNLPDIVVCIRDIAKVQVSPILVGFGVKFHGAILGVNFETKIDNGLSLRFPAGSEFLTVPSFFVTMAAAEESGHATVSVGGVCCTLSPAIGSNIIGRFIQDMFMMTDNNSSNDDDDDQCEIVVECVATPVENEEAKSITVLSASPSLHPILGSMEIRMSVKGVTVICRPSEDEPDLPGPPFLAVSEISVETPALAKLIGGTEPAHINVDYVRVTLKKAPLTLIIKTMEPVMGSVCTHMKSHMPNTVDIDVHPASSMQEDVSRLLALLPSLRVEAGVSNVEVLWEKRFSVAVSSVGFGCSLEHSKSITLSASVKKIKALDIHELVTQGFVLLDTPTDSKFADVKCAISEGGIESSVDITSLVVTLTPDSISSFAEDAKWLLGASSKLIALGEKVANAEKVAPKRRKKALLPLSVRASTGGISVIMYEDYNMIFPILAADIAVKNASAAISFPDEEGGSPYLRALELSLSRLRAEGRLDCNSSAAVLEFSEASATLDPSGLLRVSGRLDVMVQAEYIMGFVARAAALDFSAFEKKPEEHIDENHREWEVTFSTKHAIEDNLNTSFFLDTGARRTEDLESKYSVLKAISLANKALKRKLLVELDCSAKVRLCTRKEGSFSIVLQDLGFKEDAATGVKTLSLGLALSQTTKDKKTLSLCDKKCITLAVRHMDPDNHLSVCISVDAFAFKFTKAMLIDILTVLNIILSEVRPNTGDRDDANAEGESPPNSTHQEIRVHNKCNSPKLTVEKVPGIITRYSYALEGWGVVKDRPQLLDGESECLAFRRGEDSGSNSDGTPQKTLYLMLSTSDGALTFTTESTFSVTNKMWSDIEVIFGEATSNSEQCNDASMSTRGSVVYRRSLGSAPPQFIGERDAMRIRMTLAPGSKALLSEPFSMAGNAKAWVVQPCFTDPDTKTKYYVTLICKKSTGDLPKVSNYLTPGEIAPSFRCVVLSALNIKNALPAEISLDIQDIQDGSVSQLVVPETKSASALCVKRKKSIALRIVVTVASQHKAVLNVAAEYPPNSADNLNELIKQGKTSTLSFEDPSSLVARALSVSLDDRTLGEDGVWVLCFGYQYKLYNYLPIQFTAENELDMSTPGRPQKLVTCAPGSNVIVLSTQDDSVLTIPVDESHILDLDADREGCVVKAKVLTITRTVTLSSYYRIVNHTGRTLHLRQPKSSQERRKRGFTLDNEAVTFLMYARANDAGIEEDAQVTLKVDGYNETYTIDLQKLHNDGTTYIKVIPENSTNGDFKAIRIVKERYTPLSHKHFTLFLLLLMMTHR